MFKEPPRNSKHRQHGASTYHIVDSSVKGLTDSLFHAAICHQD